MSTTIDERVVEMRFDNDQFEKNAKTSISTLTRLKQSLNLTGASKGLENINSAARKVDMSGLGNAVDTVRAKFSMLDVVRGTVFANIANDAYQTGKKMIKALTIDPIKTGFQEYETQINAVQTILANTSHAGTDINDVNKALDELNKYADMTIYNFTEMTRNIGTFTAAGVDLDSSVSAIKGIANLAAVSGSTSQQASTAMYQLSQALAAGKVGLQDWNSVVNAGMGGKVFQDALIRTAAAMKGVTEETFRAQEIGTSFRESLNAKGGPSWLTSDVLTKTLRQFTLAAKEGSDEWKEYKKQLMEVDGYTEAQADEILKMANTATDAATKVKTFTQLFDVLKESAQSGWSQTWKLIVGDFEEAKALLTPLADFLTAAINGMSDFRNNILKIALDNPFTDLINKINDVTKATETVKNATMDYGAVVDKVLGGDYGNGKARWDKLAKEGYDWAKVQNLINEKLGSSVRHTEQLTDAQDKQNESRATSIEQLLEMSDLELNHLGFTTKEILALRELEEQSRKTGIAIEEIIENPEVLSGRTLLIESFKNAGDGLVTTFKLMKNAWLNAFPDTGNVEKMAAKLYDLIAGVHKFSENLRLTDKDTGALTDTGEKLFRTFKGILAVVDILTTIFGGGLKIALKAVSTLLGYFDLNILDVTAGVGDAIVAFRDWFEGMFDVSKILDYIVPIIRKAVDELKEWTANIKQTGEYKRFVAVLERIGELFTSWFDGLKDLDSIKDVPKYLVEGLVNGIVSEAKGLWDAAIELAEAIIKPFCEKLRIESPSKVFFEFGQYIVQGLINGIGSAISWVFDSIQNLGTSIINFFKGLDLGPVSEKLGGPLAKFKELLSEFDYKKLLGLIPVAAVLFMVKKLYDITSALADGINNFNDVIEGFAEIEKQFANVLKSFSLSIKADALKKMAIAIAILVASVIALTFIDTDKLGQAVTTIAILAGVLIGLAWAMGKMSDASIKIDKEGVNVSGLQKSLTAIGITLLLLAATVKIMSSMDDPGEMKRGFLGLAGAVAAIAVVFAAFGVLSKFGSTKDINKAGAMMLTMSIAMMIMISVVKLAAKLGDDDLKQAAKFAGGFTALVLLLGGAARLAGSNATKLSAMMVAMSIAMLKMIGVVKLAAKLEDDELKQAAKFVAGFTAFVGALVFVTKIGKDKSIAKLSGLLLSVSISMLLMIGICKLVNKLEPEALLKGGAFAIGFVVFIGLLKKAVSVGSDTKTAKMAGTLLAVSIAIGILAGIAVLLSLMPVDGLFKGVLAVTALGLMFTAMIWATRGAEKCVANLVVMTVAIAALAAAVGILSTLDPAGITVATMSMALLMGMFTMLVKTVGAMGKMNVSSVVGLGMMVLAIGAIGGVLYLLADLPIESTLGTAAALSLLLLAMSASLSIVSSMGPMATTGLITLGVMTLIVGALAGILYLMKDMDVSHAIGVATALTILIAGLSGVCVILGVVGMMGPAAYVGVGALVTLIAAVGGLLVGIGALAEHFPKMEEFLNKGVPILEKIGYALGSFFGNIISGFAVGVTDGLPDVATNLSTFMTNLEDFINGAKTIDETALTGVTNLAKMIALVAGASIMDTVASWVSGGSSMESFASGIDAFADGIVNFSKKVSGNIDEGSVLAAANAGKLMAEMNASIPGTGGVVQWFSGEKDMAIFGQQLIAFGDAIIGFSKKVSEEGAINETAILAAANAGKIMSEFQNGIVGTGGVVQWFCGEKDMATFGAQLVAFGTAIVDFSKVVSQEGAVNADAISAVMNAGKMMTEMQASIVPTGGVVQWFAGEKNLQTFGNQLVIFGQSIADFSAKVAGKINPEAVTAAYHAGMIMTNLQKSIPEDKWLDGKISLDDFGKQLVKFGEGIVGYSEAVAEIDTVAISTSLACANKLVSLAQTLSTVDPEAFDNFKPKSVGSALNGYYNKVAEIDFTIVSSAISSVYALKTMLQSLVGIDPEGAMSFKTALDTLGKANVGNFVDAFKDCTVDLKAAGTGMVDALVTGINSKKQTLITLVFTLSKTLIETISEKIEDFYKTGITYATQLASGIDKKRNDAKIAIVTVVVSALGSINLYYPSFYNAGSYLVSGFVAGIRDNIASAAAAAAEMAAAASAAAMANLQINSPSKVFYGIGDYSGQGFVNALYDYASIAYSAGSDMANSAKTGLSDAMNSAWRTIGGDIDMQPTIRPVLDLSDVSSGAKTLGSLFGTNPAIGVAANVGAISSNMSYRSQNGGNEDVVLALKDLKKGLNSVGGDTYTIGGITYDDGSNITDAVKSIVRAVKVGGRV